MSASNKSWLMVGGLAVVVAVIVYGTRRFQGKQVAPAEIKPATLTSEPGPGTTSRAQFPTILRAKPVTEAEPTASPRYAARDSSMTASSPQFEPLLTERQQLPLLHPTPGDPSQPTVSPAGGSVSPAFRQPSELDLPPLDQSVHLEAPVGLPPSPPVQAISPAEPLTDPGPATYLTKSQDSFWNISKHRYGGEGKYFKALYYHNRNRIERPDQIPAGVEIETPPLAELKQMYPDLCGVGQRR